MHASSVLVVDDEPDLLTLYELTLLREGLEVETAATVAQAREILQARVFRAVISDMRLPDGTGPRPAAMAGGRPAGPRR